jgi:uncharacterized membrane protein YczE
MGPRSVINGDGRDPTAVVRGLDARELRRRLPRLFVGIVLLGSGIGMMVQADLGLSPWDVFHQGISELTGLSLGVVVILVGVVVLLAWIPLRQPAGVGTVLNTLLVGVGVDVTLLFLPEAESMAVRVPLLLGGILITGVGTGLYIGSGLGPGPRDGLMTAIAARGHTLWVVRTVLELAALAAGFALGGTIGVGTLLFAFGIGPLAHASLHLFHLGSTSADLGPGTAGD